MPLFRHHAYCPVYVGRIGRESCLGRNIVVVAVDLQSSGLVARGLCGYLAGMEVEVAVNLEACTLFLFTENCEIAARGGEVELGGGCGGEDVSVARNVNAFGGLATHCDSVVAPVARECGVTLDATDVVRLEIDVDDAAVEEHHAVVNLGGVGIFVDLYAVFLNVGTDGDLPASHVEILPNVHGVANGSENVDGSCGTFEQSILAALVGMARVSCDVESALSLKLGVPLYVEACVLQPLLTVGEIVCGAFDQLHVNAFSVVDANGCTAPACDVDPVENQSAFVYAVKEEGSIGGGALQGVGYLGVGGGCRCDVDVSAVLLNRQEWEQ